MLYRIWSFRKVIAALDFHDRTIIDGIFFRYAKSPRNFLEFWILFFFLFLLPKVRNYIPHSIVRVKLVVWSMG